MRSVCVVPTNRPESLRQWLTAWQGKGGWDELIVIEDAPQRSDEVSEALTEYFLEQLDSGTCRRGNHFSHIEIAAFLGEERWIISRQDSACRCFGFLVAWWRGADYVLTLDDDCYPHPDKTGNEAYDLSLMEHHVQCMKHNRWGPSPPFNLRTRGLPYDDLGRGELHCHVNLGLWSGCLDLDARSQLEWEAQYTKDPHSCFDPRGYTMPGGSRVFPTGMYLPVSGMNLMIRREALPLFYFPLQGQGQPYRRFDDIFAGVIAKRILDHLGWHLSVGEPFVHHVRASDPKVNLEKERPGMLANETFWRRIDAAPVTGRTPLECLSSLAAHLQGDPDPYIDQLGRALWVWVRLFIERPRGL